MKIWKGSHGISRTHVTFAQNHIHKCRSIGFLFLLVSTEYEMALYLRLQRKRIKERKLMKLKWTK
jgi:hypothetical protein